MTPNQPNQSSIQTLNPDGFRTSFQKLTGPFNVAHILRYLLTICFLFGVLPNVKAADTKISDDLIGQGFVFANIGNETSSAMMLSYSVTNTDDNGAGSSMPLQQEQGLTI